MPQNFDLQQTGPELQEIINSSVPTDEYLQEQINEIVSEKATVALAATPSAVFANDETHAIVFRATSTPTDATVTFGGNGEEPETKDTENGLATFDRNVISGERMTLSFYADFEIAGVSKGRKTTTVALVWPIYYGHGDTYGEATLQASETPRASVGGTYTITTADGEHIYFELPDNMTLHSISLVSTYETSLSFHEITSSREGYKAYENIEERGAGTYNYKIS